MNVHLTLAVAVTLATRAADLPVAAAGAAGATGADEAFARFYAAQFRDLAGYCLALTADGALADELAQEAFIRVYARWRTLREPRAYAFRVAHNLAKDHWHARRRELATWADLAAQAETAYLPDATVWDVVRRLPEPYREVVVLHYIVDLPLREVARILHRPLGTVKRRVHEARALLAATLGSAS